MDYRWTIVLLLMTANCIAQPFQPAELAWGHTVTNTNSPIPLNGMLLWLKADTGVWTNNSGGLAGESNAVVEWQDQSGNNNNAYQISGESVIYVTNIINGKPSVLFYSTSGTNSYISNSSLQTPTAMTIFWVGRLNGAAFAPVLSSYSSFNQGFFADPGGGSPDLIRLVTTSSTEDYNGINLGGTIWVTLVMNGASSIARLNGVQLTSTGSIPSLTQTNGYSLGNLLVGGGNTNYFIPEYIEYTGALSSNTIVQIESYLTNKYGL
jgi:hypothetical protein